LPLNDDSDPQQVAHLTRMSKKVFKRCVGMLLKSREIVMNEEGIKLV
jgi:predicted RNA-binding protein (virulence factor B family)